MKKHILFRNIVLFTFLILFTFFSLKHFVFGPGESASVDALCPFGGFETLYSLISTGYFLPRIMMSSLILAIAVLVTVIIFRRSFCGWICPFGTAQELLGKITKKKYTVPQKVDKYGRFLKYLILAWIIIGTAWFGTLVFRGYDPFMTFFHFGKGILWDYSPDELKAHALGFSITILVLLASIFIERFWCKYFCPLGAITAILSKIGLTKIKRNADRCNDCGICNRECPVEINIKDTDFVKSAECINCSICVEKCPKQSLSYKLGKFKIKTATLAIFTIAIIFGSVFITRQLNIWHSIPQISDYSPKGRKLVGEDVKGTMSLNDVSLASGISTDIIAKALELPEHISTTLPFKSVKDIYKIDFHTESVRNFIDNYNQADYPELYNNNKPTCPWNIKNDYYPGKCGLYADTDKNSICDLSK